MAIQWKTISFVPADPSWHAIYGDEVLAVAGWLTQEITATSADGPLDNARVGDRRVIAGIVNFQGEITGCDQKQGLIEVVRAESTTEE